MKKTALTSQPFAARPFAAKTSDHPSRIGRSASQPFPYFSQTDPHLAHFFKRKFESTYRRSSLPRPATAPVAPIVSRQAGKTRRSSSVCQDKLQTYRVALKTGDGRDHGTQARVFITLCGSRGKLGKRQVPTGSGGEATGLTPGKVHRFSIMGKDIGELREVVVENSSLKEEEGWFLEHVTITNRSTGERWGCMCQQWLSLFHSDCQTTRTLSVRPLTVAVQTPPANTDYRVCVHTADVRGAGTDANVFITLEGTKGESPKTSIGNRFGRGSVESRDISCHDLGRLLSVKLEHDDSGFSSAWLPTKVEASTSLGQTVVFPCGQWLAREMGDGEIERTLTSHKQLGDSDHREQENAYQEQCRYIVSTRTGMMKGAGTDSHVFLTMVGSGGQSRRHLLDNSTENFTRGRVDKFLIEDSNVGELASLRIELVKSGLSSDWFLEHISIQEWGSKDSPIVFHCNQWIRADVNTARDGREKGVQLFGADNQTIPAQASDRDPCLTSPSQSNTASNTRSDNDSKTTHAWKVKLVTTDLVGAGTDARVFIELHTSMKRKENGSGEEGGPTLERVWLEDRPEYFERGQEDEFTLQLPAIVGSSVTGITVGHDNSNPYPEWHLDYIELTSEELGISYTFPCSQWISATENDRQEEASCYLIPGSVRTWSPQYPTIISSVSTFSSSSSQTEHEAASSSSVPHTDLSSQSPSHNTSTGIPYSIHVTLVENPQSTSKGHLVVSLTGSHCVSPPLHLLPLSKPDLLPSRTEVYSVHAPDVGSIDNIKLWLESSEKGEQWCVQEVAIHCLSKNMVYTFAGAAGSEGSRVSSETATTLLPALPTPSTTTSSCPVSQTSPDASAQLTAYEVQFITADKKKAGITGTVHLCLIGDHGQCSKVFHFHNHRGQRFQRGQTDTFQLAIQESRIGSITAVKVAHSSDKAADTADKASSWYLYKISLTRLHDRHELAFMVCQWLSASSDSGKDQLDFTLIPLQS